MTVRHTAALLTAAVLVASGCAPADPTSPAASDAGPMDAGTDAGHQHDAHPVGRLVVADHDTAKVHVYDLDPAEPALLDTFTLSAPARVTSDAAGRFAYCAQRNADTVNVIDTGLVVEDHGDHAHLHEEDPAVMDYTIDGVKPTHLVVHDGWSATFFDGSGDVTLLDEAELTLASPTMQSLPTGPAHHGVAVVALGHAIATIGTEGQPLPDQVGVWEMDALDSTPMATAPCPGLHGEAAAGTRVAFGCTDGVLFIEHNAADDTFTPHSIPNPDDNPDDNRVGNLLAHDDLDVFIGNWGATGIAILDPVAETMDVKTLDAHILARALSNDGQMMFALTADGHLHRLTAATGEPAGAPLEITGDIEIPMGHGSASPALSVGGAGVYIALPADAEVVEVDTADWAVSRRFAVPGAPYSLAVFTSPAHD